MADSATPPAPSGAARASGSRPWWKPVQEIPLYYLGGIWKRINEENIFIWAQAIAFKVLITLLPLIILATGILGLVLRQDNPFETVAGYVRSFLPGYQSDQIVGILFKLQQAGSTFTWVGAVGVIVTIITLFSTLRYIIGGAIGVQRHAQRGIMGGYLFDLRMAGQTIGLFLLSFAVTFAVNYVTTQGSALIALWGLDFPALQWGSRVLLRTLTLAIPFLISLLMFVQLYYFVPQPMPPLKSAFVGAMTATTLFEVGKNAFTIYATYLGDFDRYAPKLAPSGTEAATSIGSFFGLLLALVFWIYLSGLVLVLGAIVVSLHERKNRPRGWRVHGLWRKFVKQRMTTQVTVVSSPEDE